MGDIREKESHSSCWSKAILKFIWAYIASSLIRAQFWEWFSKALGSTLWNFVSSLLVIIASFLFHKKWSMFASKQQSQPASCLHKIRDPEPFFILNYVHPLYSKLMTLLSIQFS